MTENNQNEPLKDIAYIKDMMERSSRFISLSGLSGVCAGVFALIGAGVAYKVMDSWGANYSEYANRIPIYVDGYRLLVLAMIALTVLIASLGAGVFFTARRAKSAGLKIWDKTTERLLINLFLPLAVGGMFCLILLFHQLFGLVAPCTLIFYGMALFIAGKFTLKEVRYLGVSEMALGLIGALFMEHGLLIWAMGFGVLHIFYGALMYFKYER
jgi:hypothetical protein